MQKFVNKWGEPHYKFSSQIKPKMNGGSNTKSNDEIIFKQKYLYYKNKYLKLKKTL